MGMTAMRKTSTPMPPIQCVKLRQNRPERDRLSMSFRIEAPVVVKPETVSKNASMKRGISPLITKGSEPSSDIASHDRPTQAKPSRAYISRELGRKSSSVPPQSAVSRIVTTKGTGLSPQTSAVSSGSSISAARISSTRPRI